MKTWIVATGFVCLLVASPGGALGVEPNESFSERTLLAPGVLSVQDELTSASPTFPDTVLGVRDLFGSVYASDDDGSPLGDGTASGLGGVPTNSGSIEFVVSGYPDDSFTGGHSESGDYEVYVDVYDFFGDPVESFTEIRTLQPGGVDEFSYSDLNWIGGSYDVYIDNTVGAGGGDVDFFSFQGLVPGASFAAETANVDDGDFDSLLGWFDDGGFLIEFNDDINTGEGNYLSRISGSVPASGVLTFAVTGYGDDAFVGEHFEEAPYELLLSIAGGSPADFDGDGDVDGADLGDWESGFGLVGSATRGQGDATGDNAVRGDDFLVWQREFTGSPPLAGAPEPAAAVLAIVALAGFCGRFWRNRR